MNLDTLVESFYKKEDKNSRLINEVLQFLLEGGATGRGPAPAKQREERVLRFPILVPAEQSVGQYTADEESRDREIFELWMSKIGGSGASLEDKIQLLQTWIENPDSAAGSGTVAEALSYAMFLQTFSYMLREFNASVAGFLWEPFLAALFGGKSVQVHTEEGDIADAIVDYPTALGEEAKRQRISLKILRENGQVGGSFSDLVDHFAKNPGESMIYIVIRKEGGEKVKTEMKFMQFPVSEEAFFKIIGPPKIQKKMVRAEEVVEVEIPEELVEKFPKGLTVGQAAKVATSLLQAQEYKHLVKGAGDKIANITKGGEELARKGYVIAPGDVIEVHIDVNTKYAPEPGPDVAISQNAKNLWGYFGGKKVARGEEPHAVGAKMSDGDSYGLWYQLWDEAQGNPAKMREFWKQVQGPKVSGVPGPEWSPAGARGYVDNEQFEVSAAYESLTADNLGTINIQEELMTRAFQKAADQIGGDLTAMFNALEALIGNVAKFFLIDCGDPGGTSEECKENDVKQRSAAGKDAIENATTLKTVVDARIGPSLRDSDDDGTVDAFDKDTYRSGEPHLKILDDPDAKPGVAMGRQIPDSEYGSNE